MTYPAAVIADSPLHYWRCADPGGSLIHDIGSQPRALSASGTTTQGTYSGPCSDGGSFLFENNSGAWHNSTDLSSTPFSMEIIVWRHLLSGLVEVLLDSLGQVSIAASGAINFSPRAAFTVVTPAPITEQAWHHIACTYGPTGGTKIYIDAINVVTNASFVVAGPTATTQALGFARAGNAFSHCNVSECAIYPTELSAARVTAHFLQIDNQAGRPIWKGGGSFDITTGLAVLTSDQVDDILASVRKVY